MKEKRSFVKIMLWVFLGTFLTFAAVVVPIIFFSGYFDDVVEKQENIHMGQCFQREGMFVFLSSVSQESEPGVIEILESSGWKQVDGLECMSASVEETFYLLERKEEKGFVLVFLPEGAVVFNGESQEEMEEALGELTKKK